jgi:hypothetical protein
VDATAANTGAYSFQLFTFEDAPNAPAGQETTGTVAGTTVSSVHMITGTAGQELLILPGPTSFFGNASELASTTGQLFLDGGLEDGYDGMFLALNGYAFRPGAAVNVVLVSDEDRDVLSPQITVDTILAQFLAKNALLNAVVGAASSAAIRPTARLSSRPNPSRRLCRARRTVIRPRPPTPTQTQSPTTSPSPQPA